MHAAGEGQAPGISCNDDVTPIGYMIDGVARCAAMCFRALSFLTEKQWPGDRERIAVSLPGVAACRQSCLPLEWAGEVEHDEQDQPS